MFPRSLSVAATCLFVSGACSLVYQTVWLRTFRLIFGASTPSTAAVLAIFMGGLGLGGILLGRRVERSSRPLITYGHLELGIALSAAVTPFLLDAARAIYVGLGGSEGLGFVSTPARLLLSTLVLGVPVILMGGTLPAAARAVTAEADVGRKGLSILYGVNTLGAVSGALLSTFFLLEVYGAKKTLWIACLLNAGIGIAARAWGRKLDPVVAPAPAPKVATGSLFGWLRSTTGWVLAAAFTTGFVFLIAELVWYRLAAPLLGGSTYTFGLVLACALLGVGIGGLLYALMGPKTPTPSSFAVTCALEALVLLLPYAAGDEIAHFAFHIGNWGRVSFPLLVASWSVVTAILVFPAAVVAGYQFPMLLSLKGKAAQEVGKDSGEVYAANTLGSIVGSLSGGFVLLPAMTALGLWRASAAILMVLALVVAVIGRKDRERFAISAVLVVGTCACLLATGPTAVWRHSAIGAGRGQLAADTWNERKYVENELKRAVSAEYEGRESSVAVNTVEGVSPLINGKSDGNSYLDAPTGVGSGLIPAALHGSPKTAFVIGLGTGQTAGWLGALPSMERVDVAEIEPAMAHFAELCDATNQGALKNPKVKLHIADGRELLAVTRQRYDLVLSEPSNPFRSGVASLYSKDFYEAVNDKLTDDGVFGQWVQAYEIEPEAVQLVLATMKSVFPHLSAWQLGPGDMLLVATKKPQTWDADRLRALSSTEPYKTAFQRLFGVVGAEGVLSLHLASETFLDKLAKNGGDDVVNSDDFPRLEFLFARSVGNRQGDDLRVDIFALAQGRHLERPNVKGDVDWKKVEEQRARPFVWRNVLPSGPISANLPEPVRLWATGRSADAAKAFDMLDGSDTNGGGRKLDPFETIVDAAAHADVPDTDRTKLDGLASEADAAGYVADAAWVRVRAALTDKRAADLPTLVEAAVKASQRDPWPADRIVLPTLELLGNAPATGDEVDALNGQMAAYNFQIARATTAYRLEKQLDRDVPRAQCVRTLAAFEPWPRWRADFLDMRRRCYEHAAPDLAAVARAELDTYLAHAGGRFIVDGT